MLLKYSGHPKLVPKYYHLKPRLFVSSFWMNISLWFGPFENRTILSGIWMPSFVCNSKPLQPIFCSNKLHLIFLIRISLVPLPLKFQYHAKSNHALQLNVPVIQIPTVGHKKTPGSLSSNPNQIFLDKEVKTFPCSQIILKFIIIIIFKHYGLFFRMHGQMLRWVESM